MDTKAQGIAKHKLQLRAAISNIRKLDSMRAGAIDPQRENDIQTLILETSKLLDSLESASFAKISRTIDKRKRKRRNAKLRHKLIKNQIKLSQTNTVNSPTTKSNAIKEKKKESNNKPIAPINTSQKSHQQLQSYRDSNRFLATFELLELLHMARVDDDDSIRIFSEKLSKLRSIWNVMRLENLPERTTVEKGIHNQWKTVLFGVQEQSYYKKERNFNDLINVRYKWDSYITRYSNVGSCIPRGFVLPHENADPRWACYKTQ